MLFGEFLRNLASIKSPFTFISWSPKYAHCYMYTMYALGSISLPFSKSNGVFSRLDLEFRIDYELRTQKSIVDLYSGISSAPTAHLQYWESKDSAIFFLQTLMKHLQSQPANLDPRGTSGKWLVSTLLDTMKTMKSFCEQYKTAKQTLLFFNCCPYN